MTSNGSTLSGYCLWTCTCTRMQMNYSMMCMHVETRTLKQASSHTLEHRSTHKCLYVELAPTSDIILFLAGRLSVRAP